MKIELKEKQLKAEIDELDQEIRLLEDLLVQQETEMKVSLDEYSNQIKVIEQNLSVANSELKKAVNEYLNREKIANYISEIENAIVDKFRTKYNSTVSPVKVIGYNKYDYIKVDYNLLKNYTFTEHIKNSSWKHNSKKLIINESFKIIYYLIGAISFFRLITFWNPEGFISIIFSLLIFFILLFYQIYLFWNIYLYKQGIESTFYKNYFKNNIESNFVEKIQFLDSIKYLDKQIKDLI